MKNKLRLIFKFEIGITIFLFIIMVMSASIVYFPWYYTSKKNIKDIAGQVNEEIMNGVNQKIDVLFNDAVLELMHIKLIFQKKILDINTKEHREKLFLTTLQKRKNFSWIVLGLPNGDFIGAQRVIKEDGDYFNMVNRDWIDNVELTTKTIDLYDKELENKSTRVVYKDNYNATTRSWYKTAEQLRDFAWTKIYRFSTTGQPGINTAVSIDIDGKYFGVLSIAMELNDISKYINKIKVGKSGTVFIMNADLELIAYKNFDQDLFTTGDKIRLKKINEYKDPFLQSAYKTIFEEKINLKELKSVEQYEYFEGKKYFMSLAPSSFEGWRVVTIIPESDFLGEIYKNIRNVIIVISIFFLGAAIIALIASRKILVNPIHKITEQTKLIKNFDIENLKQIETNIAEINHLSSSMIHMSNGLKSFKKYLPTELVQDLLKQGIEVELGGEEKELTIFFSDIHLFTKIFQNLGNSLIPRLSEYFGAMSKIILENNGTIDKYIGDSIMAFWGAPIPEEEHAFYACKTAIQCQKLLKMLRINWKKDNSPLFHSRIGINTGVVVVGNIGHENRFDYTVMGDSVNIASRLESLSKFYGTSTLIGKNTYDKAKNHIIARQIDTVKVYGADHGLDVYELVDLKEEISVTDKFDWIYLYEEGLKHYKLRDWEKAFNLFLKVQKLKGGTDNPSKILAKRCKYFIQNPPEEDWDGVTVMDQK